MDKGHCWECGKSENELHWHHVIPRIYGGRGMVPLCLSCHGKVHGKPMRSSFLIKEGIKRARESGQKIGRPKKHTNETTDRVIKYRLAGLSIREVARQIGVSQGLVQRTLKNIEVISGVLKKERA